MNKKESMRDVAFLAIGEAAVAALSVLGAFLISLFTDFSFDYTVFTGALLGGCVAVLNFLFLTVSVNRAVDTYLSLRGSREMTDEEAEKFTAEHSAIIQNRIKLSFIIRTVSILVILVLAFITRLFNPLCTVIPMLASQPIVYLGEFIRKKNDKSPDPEKFKRYDNDNEEKQEI